jgi:glutathionyl-hydroquinone reductase
MGLLVEGKWRDGWIDTRSTGGRFVRSKSQFRNWITADGASGFAPAAGRYHLYVSLARPQGARRNRRRVGGRSFHGRSWLVVQRWPGVHS